MKLPSPFAALSLLLTFSFSGSAVWADAATKTEQLLPAQETAPIQAPFAIKAAVPNHPRQVMKFGKHFMVMEETGLMPLDSTSGCGIYRDDTRYLSGWDITLNGEPITLLSANTELGYAGRFLYGNKASHQNEADKMVPEQSIFVQRDVVITDGVRERMVVTNFSPRPAEVTLAIKYGADFADMFEVRGQARKLRGQMTAILVDKEKRTVTYEYKGLDGKPLKTVVAFARQNPIATEVELKSDRAVFKFMMEPKAVNDIEAVVATNDNEPMAGLFDGEDVSDKDKKYSYDVQKSKADSDYLIWRSRGATISSDDADFNRLLERNFRDLYILRQPTPRGMCLAAGIPWFTVAFGRDQDITAHETLPLLPEMTKEILGVLAAYQGVKDDDFTEEHPGRIMHELRIGEMARCREIPFIPFYGTVDATPLWLGLLDQYVQWTGDLETAKKYWPNVERALAYLDKETAQSHYLTYGKKGGSALSNQGWKDSSDSIMYSDGRLAKPPIALIEVQAYLYDAWMRTAHLATLLDHKDVATRLTAKAQDLQQRVQKDYWMPSHNYACIALDGDGKQCDASASNPGHALVTGILTEQQDVLVADKLNNPEMFSGWGVRTLSAFERAYNPLSYHDGSVWPHDNAMIVEGLCAVGRKKEAGAISGGIFRVACNQPDYRLPELFCGLSRNYSDRPVWYPVSCSPQAWAAGSMFLMLDSLLGLKADALNHTLHVVNPSLPPFLNRLTMKNVRIADSAVDLKFTRDGDKTKCEVLRKGAGIQVIVE